MPLGRLLRALGQRAGGNLGVRSLHKSHRCPGQVARMTELSTVGARPESRALWDNREENMPGYSQITMSTGKWFNWPEQRSSKSCSQTGCREESELEELQEV